MCFRLRRGWRFGQLPVPTRQSVVGFKRGERLSIGRRVFVTVVIAENYSHLSLWFYRIRKFVLWRFVTGKFTTKHVHLSWCLDAESDCVSLHFDNSNFYVVTDDDFLILLP
jgi:hypothetical protein